MVFPAQAVLRAGCPGQNFIRREAGPGFTAIASNYDIPNYDAKDGKPVTEQPSAPTVKRQNGLSEVEKRMLRQMIERGEHLPHKYRSVLFAPAQAPELIWDGKYDETRPSDTQFEVLERVQRPGALDAFSAPAAEAAPAGSQHSVGEIRDQKMPSRIAVEKMLGKESRSASDFQAIGLG